MSKVDLIGELVPDLHQPRPRPKQRPDAVALQALDLDLPIPAAKLVLEPIFEADLDPAAYRYRPGRSGTDAIKAVHTLLCRGFTDVVDADLSKYFALLARSSICSVALPFVRPETRSRSPAGTLTEFAGLLAGGRHRLSLSELTADLTDRRSHRAGTQLPTWGSRFRPVSGTKGPPPDNRGNF